MRPDIPLRQVRKPSFEFARNSCRCWISVHSMTYVVCRTPRQCVECGLRAEQALYSLPAFSRCIAAANTTSCADFFVINNPIEGFLSGSFVWGNQEVIGLGCAQKKHTVRLVDPSQIPKVAVLRERKSSVTFTLHRAVAGYNSARAVQTLSEFVSV